MKKLMTPTKIKSALLALPLLMAGCTSRLVNYALKSRGIYDDRIALRTMDFRDKKIVFFPMHHVGTQNFYDDAGHKVDSLRQLGYFFYTEKVNAGAATKEEMMKVRKILGIGLPNGGYQNTLEAILKEKNIKLSHQVAYQPAYTAWHLTEQNSTNADATLPQVVAEYERRYGKIVLEPCDLATPDIALSTKCRSKAATSQAAQAIIIDYRNRLLAKKIMEEKRQNLAIIYGAGHYEGIKKILDSAAGR